MRTARLEPAVVSAFALPDRRRVMAALPDRAYSRPRRGDATKRCSRPGNKVTADSPQMGTSAAAIRRCGAKRAVHDRRRTKRTGTRRPRAAETETYPHLGIL